MESKIVREENSCGGIGFITIEHLLSANELKDKGNLFAKVTVEPGNTCGYHVHTGESETYYILSGEGEYNDNGTVRTVKAGDITFTPDGAGHGMKCLGDEPLVFIALILNS